jgi:hypothetical protein
MDSFIAKAAVERTRLPIQARPRLMTTMANGKKVPCPGVIRHAPLVDDDIDLCVDLFVMPLLQDMMWCLVLSGWPCLTGSCGSSPPA